MRDFYWNQSILLKAVLDFFLKNVANQLFDVKQQNKKKGLQFGSNSTKLKAKFS